MESHRDSPKGDGKGDLGPAQAEEIRLPDADRPNLQPDDEPDEEFDPYPIEHSPALDRATFRATVAPRASPGI